MPTTDLDAAMLAYWGMTRHGARVEFGKEEVH